MLRVSRHLAMKQRMDNGGRMSALLSQRTPFAPGPILRSLREFGDQVLEPEMFCRLRDARVIFADYELIVHDFEPRFGRPGDAIDGEVQRAIDDFLVEHCGVISAVQAAQTVTNSHIEIKQRRRLGYRPPYYGRAAVMPAGDPARFMDVKGIGVQPGEIPKNEAHGTGLLLATEAVHEFLFERLCGAAFHHAGGEYEVVPSYAILDLGFMTVPWRNRRRERAVAIVRRAHTRPRNQWDDDEPPGPVAVGVMRDVALLLRRYGITSTAGDYRIEERDGALVLHARDEEFVFRDGEALRVAAMTGYAGGVLPIDAVNVQYTTGVADTPPHPQIYDFGSFRASADFQAPIYVASSAREVDLVGEMILPGDSRFPRADRCRLPERANLVGSRLAWEYVHGRRSGASIARAIDRFVQRCFRHAQ